MAIHSFYFDGTTINAEVSFITNIKGKEIRIVAKNIKVKPEIKVESNGHRILVVTNENSLCSHLHEVFTTAQLRSIVAQLNEHGKAWDRLQE